MQWRLKGPWVIRPIIIKSCDMHAGDIEGPWVIRPIIIKSCDIHAGDIRGAMGEIASYHERD
jgi:hypothetical protein